MSPFDPESAEQAIAKRWQQPGTSERTESRRKQGERDAGGPIADQVALDAAVGKSKKQSAKEIGISLERVNGLRTNPRVKERIEDMRAYLRQQSLERLTKLHDGLYDGIETAIKGGDGRQVDSWSRAAASLEKVRASTSGEFERAAPAPVQVNVTQQGASAQDLVDMLRELGIGTRTVVPPA